jgi:hypothetical protein
MIAGVYQVTRCRCQDDLERSATVSHDPLAAGYADRVCALREGELADYQPDLIRPLDG